MAHIQLPEGAPGIVGLMIAYPETRVHLSGLAEALLRGPSSLTPGERELIASYVSSGNACKFCMQSHAAAARVHFGEKSRLVDQVLADLPTAPVSAKMRALLAIADKVRRDGRLVQAADVERARAEGADDKAIHDTVLIAAAFCMFNRYVDGLGTWAPEDPAHYEETGQRLANQGYVHYDFSKG
ncbi:MAG TPA: carboxymuconolactone decarboxylase family protein [Isosphaeraceae bacterium]|nr:carboxymuconolactone decarboxylase family protein [Isosphaeraceae bacterium]